MIYVGVTFFYFKEFLDFSNKRIRRVNKDICDDETDVLGLYAMFS